MSTATNFQEFVISVHPLAEAQQSGKTWRIVDGGKAIGSGSTVEESWEDACASINRAFVRERHPNARAVQKGLRHCMIYDGTTFMAGAARESDAWARVAEDIREAELDAQNETVDSGPSPR